MAQLDTVQEEMFHALQREKRRAAEAEAEAERLRGSIAQLAEQQAASTAFALHAAGMLDDGLLMVAAPGGGALPLLQLPPPPPQGLTHLEGMQYQHTQELNLKHESLMDSLKAGGVSLLAAGKHASGAAAATMVATRQRRDPMLDFASSQSMADIQSIANEWQT